MKKAILLLNMGGPNNLDEVELFLRNMFADPRILPINSMLRGLIGKRIVQKRLIEAQSNYQKIGGKSPLSDISISLARKIQDLSGIPTRLAMRYVPPLTDQAMMEFRDMWVDELILFPMYPHYSTTTTLSSIDEVQASMDRLSYYPEIRTIEPYYAHREYIDIIIDRITSSATEIETREYDLILSAHGLPMSIIEAGDPYMNQIEAHYTLIKDTLSHKGIVFRDVKLAYQSKVGNGAWLEPNLTDVLRTPQNTKVLVYPLAFTIDNSETVFELDIEHREIADKIGYDDYRVVPCPNDGDDFASFIASIADA